MREEETQGAEHALKRAHSHTRKERRQRAEKASRKDPHKHTQSTHRHKSKRKETTRTDIRRVEPTELNGCKHGPTGVSYGSGVQERGFFDGESAQDTLALEAEKKRENVST